MAAPAEVVRASGVRYVYPDGTVLSYAGPDLVVRRGEAVLLLGPNGSGKSTLLYLLMGLLGPAEGVVQVFGREPARAFQAIRERVGVLLQDAEQQIVAPTVRADIGFSPRNYGYPEDEIERRVARVARELEIEHLLDRVPHYLSGGETLKVALAGALVLEPALLLLDEPFERLDSASKAELVAILAELRSRREVAMVLATHEVDLAASLVDTVYLLAPGGALAHRGRPDQVLTRTDLLAAYHVEPPILVRLFAALRRRGIDLGPGLTVEAAADRIATWASSASGDGASRDDAQVLRESGGTACVDFSSR